MVSANTDKQRLIASKINVLKHQIENISNNQHRPELVTAILESMLYKIASIDKANEDKLKSLQQLLVK